MPHQHSHRSVDLGRLGPLEPHGRDVAPVKAHANPRRAGHQPENARDDRHRTNQLLHDVERGIIPDELA